MENKNKPHLIVPNKVIEVQINRKKIIFDTNIEKQIEELVAFFEPMRFTKSSQLSPNRSLGFLFAVRHREILMTSKFAEDCDEVA